jgi:hypothetical protein
MKILHKKTRKEEIEDFKRNWKAACIIQENRDAAFVSPEEFLEAYSIEKLVEQINAHD